jgi:NAD(P)-dependent dehydrogenase (short-subunit alcohol dehydrogenase family)
VHVTLADVDDEGVTQLAGTLGPLALPLKLDVTNHPAVDGLLDSIPPDFRPIDILINNAGHDVGGRTHFARGPADDWTSILDVNLTGMMRVTRAVVPAMIDRNSGDIVNMSSISALRLVPETVAYTTSKAGVRAFSDGLRADLAETAIRVTEVLLALRGPISFSSVIAVTGRSRKRILTRLERSWSQKTSPAWCCSRSNNRRTCKSPNSSSYPSTGGEPHTCEPGCRSLALRRLSGERWDLHATAPCHRLRAFVSSAPTPASAARVRSRAWLSPSACTGWMQT